MVTISACTFRKMKKIQNERKRMILFGVPIQTMIKVCE